MIHYHGTPITPRATLLTLVGRCFCVSYADDRDVEVCHEIGQSVMLDNGAFSAYTQRRTPDWPGFYEWAEPWLDYQTTWAVIPDVIDGSEEQNDALIEAWPHGTRGAPVWHLHESIDRLLRLAEDWPRVCLGSSGVYWKVGDASWHRRMHEAMDALCGDGPAPVWLHMLRGLSLAGSEYPFASADSVNVGRNQKGTPHRGGIRKDARSMTDRIDAQQCAPRWRQVGVQQNLLASP